MSLADAAVLDRLRVALVKARLFHRQEQAMSGCFLNQAVARLNKQVYTNCDGVLAIVVRPIVIGQRHHKKSSHTTSHTR